MDSEAMGEVIVVGIGEFDKGWPAAKWLIKGNLIKGNLPVVIKKIVFVHVFKPGVMLPEESGEGGHRLLGTNELISKMQQHLKEFRRSALRLLQIQEAKTVLLRGRVGLGLCAVVQEQQATRLVLGAPSESSWLHVGSWVGDRTVEYCREHLDASIPVTVVLHGGIGNNQYEAYNQPREPVVPRPIVVDAIEMLTESPSGALSWSRPFSQNSTPTPSPDSPHTSPTSSHPWAKLAAASFDSLAPSHQPSPAAPPPPMANQNFGTVLVTHSPSLPSPSSVLVHGASGHDPLAMLGHMTFPANRPSSGHPAGSSTAQPIRLSRVSQHQVAPYASATSPVGMTSGGAVRPSNMPATFSMPLGTPPAVVLPLGVSPGVGGGPAVSPAVPPGVPSLYPPVSGGGPGVSHGVVTPGVSPGGGGGGPAVPLGVSPGVGGGPAASTAVPPGVNPSLFPPVNGGGPGVSPGVVTPSGGGGPAGSQGPSLSVPPGISPLQGGGSGPSPGVSPVAHSNPVTYVEGPSAEDQGGGKLKGGSGRAPGGSRRYTIEDGVSAEGVDQIRRDIEEELLNRYTLDEVYDATDNFDERNRIESGRGGNHMWRGIMDDMQVTINEVRSGQEHFRQEINVMKRICHKNVVSLLGYCIECAIMEGIQRGPFQILEFSCKGSLASFLDPQAGNEALTWMQRKVTVVGVARGLRYLHEFVRGGQILHGYVCRQNIFLDDKLEPLVANFSAAAQFYDDKEIRTFRCVFGEAGYMPPEARRGVVTEKSDVYSFGVVVLEVLTGLQPIHSAQGPLVELALANQSDPLSLADPRLESQLDGSEFDFIFWLALQCTQPDLAARPLMKQVVYLLEKHLKMPERAGSSTPSEQEFTSLSSGSFTAYEIRPNGV